jgi:hypothetical protein
VNAFIPISSTYTDPTGALIALGAAPIGDAGGSAAALEPLFQMSNSSFAGEASIELVGGAAQIRARVSEAVAANKVATGVYRGFALSLLKGSDGSTRCARVALVDTPQLAKSSEGVLLKLARGPIMPNNNPLLHTREVRLAVRQARDRRSEELRLAKASNPPPGGFARPEGEQEWQGTSNTRGGRGRDKAGYGEDQGTDAAMTAVRRALASPFREAGGLITMLGSR